MSEKIGKRLTKKQLTNIRNKAAFLKVPFNLTQDDCVIPERCPVLGWKFSNRIRDRKPSVDRIIPRLGYVRGNILIVSVLANQVKSSGTPEEIMRVGNFYKRLIQERANG